MCMDSNIGENFVNWMVEQRINFLVQKEALISEEQLINKMKSILSNEGADAANQETRLALLADRMEAERDKLYFEGLKDGIALFKNI